MDHAFSGHRLTAHPFPKYNDIALWLVQLLNICPVFDHRKDPWLDPWIQCLGLICEAFCEQVKTKTKENKKQTTSLFDQIHKEKKNTK